VELTAPAVNDNAVSSEPDPSGPPTPERGTPTDPPERLTPSDPPERLTPAEPPERLTPQDPPG